MQHMQPQKKLLSGLSEMVMPCRKIWPDLKMKLWNREALRPPLVEVDRDIFGGSFANLSLGVRAGSS